MADYSGGPKGLKPNQDVPKNTEMPGQAVPVVQPNPFGSSQTPEVKTKTTPVVKSKKL